MNEKTAYQPIRSALMLACLILSALYQDAAYAETVLQEAQAIKVHDGDTVTLMIKGKMVKTRLIGIDAPEMGQRPWGRRAREHLVGIIKDSGWIVYVETDIVKRDKYDRLLAYLRTKQDAIINERMLQDGHAVLFTISPNVKYVAEFTRAERRARSENKGLWASNGLKEKPFTYRKKHPRQ